MRISRGFAASLFGIGMTILSWYGPWSWPAWPALTTLHAFFGGNDIWWDLSFQARSLLVALLIAVNVAFWGVLLRSVIALTARVLQASIGRVRVEESPASGR
jgi:hypothetical protein